jgi:hypothetical protein
MPHFITKAFSCLVKDLGFSHSDGCVHIRILLHESIVIFELFDLNGKVLRVQLCLSEGIAVGLDFGDIRQGYFTLD